MKPDQKSQLFIILILMLAQFSFVFSAKQISWDYNKGGADWPEDCKQGDQAPIDISQPFTFKEMNRSFFYTNMMTEYSFLNDGNILLLEGDFGYMIFNNVTYFSSQINFYSPSMHTFGNKHLPLEMQVIHHDGDGNMISISVLFKYSENDYSIFLGKLGFDKPDLENQAPFKPNNIKDEINLSKYIHNEKDFFVYQGNEAAPPCVANTTYLIVTDVLKISKKQLDNFPLIVKNKNRIMQLRNERKIFTTFKMEDIEKKQKEIRKKVEELKKVKEEEEKIKKVQEEKEAINLQPKKNLNSTANNTDILDKFRINKTSPEYKQIQQEIDKILKKKNQIASNKTDTCLERDMIPFNVVKEKAKAYEDYIKSSDPKFIGNTPDKNATLIIDKELPKSESEVKRISLEEKYQFWKKLYDQSIKGGQKNPHVFIQMKALEKELKNNNYEPFMKDRQLLIDDNFVSFVQLSLEEEFKSYNKIDFSYLTKQKTVTDADRKLAEQALNSSSEDLDKILTNFIIESAKNSRAEAEAKQKVEIEEIKKKAEFEKEQQLQQNSNPMKPIIDFEGESDVKNVTLFKTAGVVNENGEITDNKKIENGQRVTVSKNQNNTFGIDARLKIPLTNKEMNTDGTQNNDVQHSAIQQMIQPDSKISFLLRKDNSEEKQITLNELIKDNLKKDHTNADVENKENDFTISMEKMDAEPQLELKTISVDTTAGIVKEETLEQTTTTTTTGINPMPLFKVVPFEQVSVPVPEVKIIPVAEVKVVSAPVVTSPPVADVKVVPAPVVTSPPVADVKVVPAPVVNVVPVVQDVNLKVTAPLPHKQLDVPNMILNDKITQLEKDSFDEKLSRYNRIKDSFAKTVIENSNDLELLNPEHAKNINEDVEVIEEKTKVNTIEGVKIIDEKSHKLEEINDSQMKQILPINKNFEGDQEKQNFLNNVVKYEQMRNVADVLANSLNVKNKKIEENKIHVIKNDSTKEKKKIIYKSPKPFKSSHFLKPKKNLRKEIQKNFLPVEEVFDTNLDYNKKIYNTVKIVFSNLITEFKKLDEINERVYKKSTENSFLTQSGLIRFTTKNLAVLIRKSLSIDNDQTLSYDEKVNSLYDFTSKSLLSQNKNIKENNEYFDAIEVEAKDVNQIIDLILLKNDFNQYELENMDFDKIRNLVVKIFQKLPVILIKKDENNKINEHYDASDSYDAKKLRENYDDEDMFITKKSANNLKDEMKILGPKVKEEKEAQLSPKPGEGRKAVSKDGTIDKTDIFNTSTWPSICKTGDQSPININKPYIPEETDLIINLKAPKGKLTLINDGFKLVFSANSFGFIQHGAHRFDAKLIEIHHPSEHTFGDDEVRAPMEIQIICQDIFGNIAAVSVLFKLEDSHNQFLSVLGFGVDNPLFALKLRNGQEITFDEKSFSEKLNLGPLVNNSQHYVNYIGSLTSPPCTQNVQWFVLLQKVGVSQTQLEYFPILFGREYNVRGLQSLNTRKLKII